MKRLISILLSQLLFILSVVICFGTSLAATDYIDTFETDYCVYSEYKTYIYFERIKEENLKTVTIPDFINGKPVTVIGYHALGNSRDTTEKVIIGNNVELIDSDAFSYSPKLKTVVFSDSVKTIGIGAFYGCSSLEEISFGSGLDEIEEWAFEDCYSLKTVSFNKAIKKIDGCAFRNCTALVDVTFPNRIDKIGDNSFNGCTALKEVTLPKKIKYLGVNTFENTGFSKDEANYKDGSLYCSNYLLKYNPEATGKVKVEEGTVGIGARAFDKTNGITSVRLPASLRYITSRAFNGMKKLRAITVSKESKYFSSKKGILYNKAKTRLVRYPAAKSGSSFKVSKTVKTINAFAFYKADLLKNVELPGNVKYLNVHSFDNCKRLKRVKLNKGLKKIGKYAFYRCKRIKSISIPKSVKSIGDYAIGYDYMETAETDGGQKTEHPYGKVVIKGYKKSAAQRYCKDGGGFNDWSGYFKFIALD
ncbi:MAG: leucine-rich repeat domain-containing protein [Eubacterium sp.]|nr:leucine-rich repeat domain-containing protein [Eubacterium sp.]